MRLNNKVIVITGGGRGIGKGIAERMAEEGGELIILEKDYDVGLKVAEEINQKAPKHNSHAIECDITDEHKLKKTIEDIANTFERIDVLVNNASIIYNEPFLETKVEHFDQQVSVNYRGTFLCCFYTAHQMVKQNGGKIINVVSPNAVVGAATASTYCSTKAAVSLLTKTMAIELAPYNINVNGLGPGFTQTRLTQPLIDNPDFIDKLMQRIPQGRVAQPKDIAGGAVFLASSDADFVNGHILYVDGGFLAG